MDYATIAAIPALFAVGGIVSFVRTRRVAKIESETQETMEMMKAVSANAAQLENRGFRIIDRSACKPNVADSDATRKFFKDVLAAARQEIVTQTGLSGDVLSVNNGESSVAVIIERVTRDFHKRLETVLIVRKGATLEKIKADNPSIISEKERLWRSIEVNNIHTGVKETCYELVSMGKPLIKNERYLLAEDATVWIHRPNENPEQVNVECHNKNFNELRKLLPPEVNKSLIVVGDSVIGHADHPGVKERIVPGMKVEIHPKMVAVTITTKLTGGATKVATSTYRQGTPITDIFYRNGDLSSGNFLYFLNDNQIKDVSGIKVESSQSWVVGDAPTLEVALSEKEPIEPPEKIENVVFFHHGQAKTPFTSVIRGIRKRYSLFRKESGNLVPIQPESFPHLGQQYVIVPKSGPATLSITLVQEGRREIKQHFQGVQVNDVLRMHGVKVDSGNVPTVITVNDKQIIGGGLNNELTDNAVIEIKTFKEGDWVHWMTSSGYESVRPSVVYAIKDKDLQLAYKSSKTNDKFSRFWVMSSKCRLIAPDPDKFPDIAQEARTLSGESLVDNDFDWLKEDKSIIEDLKQMVSSVDEIKQAIRASLFSDCRQLLKLDQKLIRNRYIVAVCALQHGKATEKDMKFLAVFEAYLEEAKLSVKSMREGVLSLIKNPKIGSEMLDSSLRQASANFSLRANKVWKIIEKCPSLTASQARHLLLEKLFHMERAEIFVLESIEAGVSGDLARARLRSIYIGSEYENVIALIDRWKEPVVKEDVPVPQVETECNNDSSIVAAKYSYNSYDYDDNW